MALWALFRGSECGREGLASATPGNYFEKHILTQNENSQKPLSEKQTAF